MQEAGEYGIQIHICEMSMDLMGFKPEEMIDYPHLDFVGAGSFIQMILNPAVQTGKSAYRLRLKRLMAIEVFTEKVTCGAVRNYGKQTPL